MVIHHPAPIIDLQGKTEIEKKQEEVICYRI